MRPFSTDDLDEKSVIWAQGVAGAIADLLRRTPDLDVLGEASSFADASAEGDDGAPVDDDTVRLVGTFARSHDELSVTTRLIDPRGAELWSGSWARPVFEVFDLQTEIAHQVSDALGTNPTERAQRLIHREPTTDMVAYDLYLVGRRALSQPSERSIDEAVRALEEAATRDSLFADAWGSLSECYRVAHERYLPIGVADPVAAARRAAEQALEVDPSIPPAILSLGYAELGEWQLKEAERRFEEAIDVAPSLADAHRWLAHTRALMGDFSGGLRSASRALELDPRSDVVLNEAGWIHALAGRPAEAKEFSRQVIHQDPEHVMAYFQLGQYAAQLTKSREAVTYFRAAAELSGRVPFLTAFLGMALVAVGDRNEATDIANDLRRKARRGSPVAACFGALLARLGQVDEAMEWLEVAIDNREAMALMLDTHWLPLPELRSDARFAALLSRLPSPGVEGQRP